MKLYQLINGSGNPASVQENDLAIFSSPKHAQEALDYFAEFGDVGDVTIKEISKLEDIVRN